MATKRNTITNRTNLSRLEPGRYRHETERGLWLKVTEAGRRYFHVRGTPKGLGREITRKLGEFHPDTERPDTLTLAQAREAAAEARALFLQGIDPKTEKSGDAIETFGGLVEAMLSDAEQRGDRKPSGIKGDRRNLEVFLFDWKARPLGELTPEVIADRLVSIAKGRAGEDGKHGGPTAANRVRALISSAWRYAPAEFPNPIRGRHTLRPQPEVKAFTILPKDETAAFLEAVDAIGGDFADLIRIGLATGLRRSNLLGLRWEWLDGLDGDRPTVTVPASDFKGKRDHTVPIVPQAADILRRRRAERPASLFVFPSETSKRGHLGECRRAWRKLVPFLEARTKNGSSDVIRPGWHVLRRRLAVALKSVSNSRDVAGDVLGHKRGTVTELYTETETDPEAVRGHLERAVNQILGTVAEVVAHPNSKAAGA